MSCYPRTPGANQRDDAELRNAAFDTAREASIFTCNISERNDYGKKKHILDFFTFQCNSLNNFVLTIYLFIFFLLEFSTYSIIMLTTYLR